MNTCYECPQSSDVSCIERICSSELLEEVQQKSYTRWTAACSLVEFTSGAYWPFERIYYEGNILFCGACIIAQFRADNISCAIQAATLRLWFLPIVGAIRVGL